MGALWQEISSELCFRIKESDVKDGRQERAGEGGGLHKQISLQPRKTCRPLKGEQIFSNVCLSSIKTGEYENYHTYIV